MSYPIAVLALRSAIVIGSSMGYTAGLCQSAVSVGDCSGSAPTPPAPAPWWYLKPALRGLLPASSARLALFSALDSKSPRRLSGSASTSTGGAGSKMSDKKDTAASLGHSEELRIKYPPRQTVPELVHFGQELSESLPTFA